MVRKLSLLMASIAVVAFTAPAAASAAPAITDPPGTLLKTGALLQATGLLFPAVKTSLGEIECFTFNLTGELTANTGSTVKAVGKGAGSSMTCTLAKSKAVTITDITLKELHSATAGIGTVSLTFAADLPGGIVCHFESAGLPYAKDLGEDQIKFVNADLKGTPAACEPGLFNAVFTLETDGGGSVILD